MAWSGQSFDPALAQLASRALIYGLARMATDGHLAEWAVPGRTPEQAMQDALDFFIGQMAAPAQRHGVK